MGFFGDPPVGGEETDDDDLDGRTNEQEFLAGTNPTVVDAPPELGMVKSGDNLEFTLPVIPGRSVILEASEDLVEWREWTAPGNDGLPRDSESPAVFSVPTVNPSEFFRATIGER